MNSNILMPYEKIFSCGIINFSGKCHNSTIKNHYLCIIITKLSNNILNMKHLDNIFAEKLLKISAIKLQPNNPFTWASGWNSPIYTDNRKTLSYPDVRSFIKVELCRLI